MSKKIKLSNITPDDKNNNKHTAYGMDLLEKSVNKVGIIESITISNDDKIISGNARHEVIGKHFEKEAHNECLKHLPKTAITLKYA